MLLLGGLLLLLFGEQFRGCGLLAGLDSDCPLEVDRGRTELDLCSVLATRLRSGMVLEVEPDLDIAGLVNLDFAHPGEFLVSSLRGPLDVNHGRAQAVLALPQVPGTHEVARRYSLDRDDLIREHLAP